MSAIIGAGAPPPPPFGDNDSSQSFAPPMENNPVDAGSSSVTEPPLTGIQPISIKKTLMVVNNFIINTTDFLNKFCALSEQKLTRVTQQVQRLEIVLALLEAKLESIQWLSGSNGTATTNTAAAATADTSSTNNVPTAPPTTNTTEAQPAATPAADAGAASNGAPVMLLKDDPRYSKYFKMLLVGVPKVALRMKMTADGVDPDQIDRDPESAAPPQDPNSKALVVVQVEDEESSEEDNEYDED